MFKLNLNTDNAAFDQDDMIEVARILRDVARALEDEGQEHGHCRDINGNHVGAWALIKD